MIAYIQQVDGKYANVNFYTAFTGFTELGYEIINFEYIGGQFHINNKLVEYFHDEICRDDVVMAGVPVISTLLSRMKIKTKVLPSYPDELKKFTVGGLHVGTIGEVRERVQKGIPTFVKPLDEDRKLFNGSLAKTFRSLTYTASLPDIFPVFVADKVEILSEYRVFIHKHEIIGCKNYRGDFFIAPDKSTVQNMIDNFLSAPIAYALDVGTIHSKDPYYPLDKPYDTILIEVSDATSLGCYGLFDVYYAKMIADRWNQIVSVSSE